MPGDPQAGQLAVSVFERLTHPIARPLDDDGFGVMEEAIEESGGQRAVVIEDLRPGLEGSIRSQDHGASLIALTDHLKERIGTELVDWQVAQFVDDEERRLREPRHLAVARCVLPTPTPPSRITLVCSFRKPKRKRC